MRERERAKTEMRSSLSILLSFRYCCTVFSCIAIHVRCSQKRRKSIRNGRILGINLYKALILQIKCYTIHWPFHFHLHPLLFLSFPCFSRRREGYAIVFCLNHFSSSSTVYECFPCFSFFLLCLASCRCSVRIFGTENIKIAMHVGNNTIVFVYNGK